jgi:hypothetical protein
MNKQIYIYIYEDSEYLNKKEILLIMKYQKQINIIDIYHKNKSRKINVEFEIINYNTYNNNFILNKKNIISEV